MQVSKLGEERIHLVHPVAAVHDLKLHRPNVALLDRARVLPTGVLQRPPWAHVRM